MTRKSPTGRTAVLLFTLPCIALLAACGSVRLQTPQQAVHSLSHSAQAQARKSCEQHRDSRDYFDCVKRSDQHYDAWREERAAKELANKNS